MVAKGLCSGRELRLTDYWIQGFPGGDENTPEVDRGGVCTI